MNSFLTDRQDNTAVSRIHRGNTGCAADHDLAVIPALFQFCLHLECTLRTIHMRDDRALFLRLTRTPGGKLAHTGQSLGDASCLIQLNNRAFVC